MQITKVYMDNIQYLNKCGANHQLGTFKWIREYTQGLQFRRRDHSYLRSFKTTIRSNLWSEGASSMMSWYPSKQIPMILRSGDFIWRQLIGISIPKTISKRSRAGQLRGWCCAVMPRIDKPPQVKVFLVVGVEAFVPDRLVDGIGRRWRFGERRKTLRWTMVVWGQILGVRFVQWNFRGNVRTQAAGVFWI